MSWAINHRASDIHSFIHSFAAIHVLPGIRDAIGADERCQSFDRLMKRLTPRACRPDLRLPPYAADFKLAAPAVKLWIKPPDQSLAFKYGQHVIAVASFHSRHERFKTIIEVKQPQRTLTIAQHWIKWAK